MFNVNANLFRACALFQSTEETRYYLCGVSIEPHPVRGVLLVAIDGHRCLVAHDPEGTTDGRYIVRLDKPALAACKAGAHENDRRVVGADPAEMLWIQDADGEQLQPCENWLVDGSFPDWQRVIPRASTISPAIVGFNASRLASFDDVAGILSGNGKTAAARGISIATCGDNGPALIRFLCTDKVFGVLMPVRIDAAIAATLPDFMDPPKASATTADAEPEGVMA